MKKNSVAKYIMLAVLFAVMNSCAAGLESNDFRKRYNAVMEITDQQLLAKIAVEDDHEKVRSLAVNRLTNTALLSVIADSKEPSVRYEATRRLTALAQQYVKKFTKQQSLKKVALEGQNQYIRKAAAGNLTDQSLLLAVLKQSKEWPVRITAVKRITDPAILIQIAITEEDKKIRSAAFANVTNIDILSDIYVGSDSVEVRKEVGVRRLAILNEQDKRNKLIERSTNQAYLIKAALEDEWYINRLKATEKLTDQAILEKIAIHEKNKFVRSQAAAKLTNMTLLERLAVEDKYGMIRSDALKKISNIKIISKVAVTDEDSAVRETAVKMLSDQTLLAKIAVEDNSIFVRNSAILRLTDQEVLTKVAFEDYYIENRKAAVERITDQVLLGEIAQSARYSDARELAIEKLTDQAILKSIVKENTSWNIRKKAFGKLTLPTLSTLAQETGDKAIKIAVDIKQGRKTWSEVFYGANISPGTALGAVALFEHQKSAATAVVLACHRYIRSGDVARIPELDELLTLYGNVQLAEDYINCGHSKLSTIGRAWARSHGYSINRGPGSNRVKWGEGFKIY